MNHLQNFRNMVLQQAKLMVDVDVSGKEEDYVCEVDGDFQMTKLILVKWEVLEYNGLLEEEAGFVLEVDDKSVGVDVDEVSNNNL